MMVDQFTKWTESIPLPSKGAEGSAQNAINTCFNQFGYPFQFFFHTRDATLKVHSKKRCGIIVNEFQVYFIIVCVLSKMAVITKN